MEKLIRGIANLFKHHDKDLQPKNVLSSVSTEGKTFTKVVVLNEKKNEKNIGKIVQINKLGLFLDERVFLIKNSNTVKDLGLEEKDLRYLRKNEYLYGSTFECERNISLYNDTVRETISFKRGNEEYLILKGNFNKVVIKGSTYRILVNSGFRILLNGKFKEEKSFVIAKGNVMIGSGSSAKIGNELNNLAMQQ